MADTLETGRAVDRVELRVEAGKIREFVRATDTTDPVHLGTGGGVPVAPLTYSVATAHRRDQAGFLASLGLAIDRVVVGGVSWEYRRPLVAGDVLDAVRTVVSDATREGRNGVLRLVGLVTEFTDAAGDVVLVQHETLIERAAS